MNERWDRLGIEETTRLRNAEPGAIQKDVIALQEKHRNTWRGKAQWFWAIMLCEEFCELLLSLIGLHRHAPDVELRQIAAICMNWLEMRDNRRIE